MMREMHSQKRNEQLLSTELKNLKEIPRENTVTRNNSRRPFFALSRIKPSRYQLFYNRLLYIYVKSLKHDKNATVTPYSLACLQYKKKTSCQIIEKL
jgi:hypothetical protein